MDLKYHINQLKSFKDLKESLKEISQIEPIIVFKDGKNEFIVDGLKRMEILTEWGFEIEKKIFTNFVNLFIYVLNSKEIHDSTVWKYLHILKEKKYSEKDIYNYFIKRHLKLSVRDIWKLLKIEYSEKIEKMIINLDINLKELLLYHDFESKYFYQLLLLFENLKANRNTRRDLFYLIDEILKKDKINFKDLLDKKEIREIVDSELQPNDKIAYMKKLLFKLRYPLMSEEIEKLINIKNKIKTPGFKLDLPIDKESSRSGISFQFRNFREFERKVNALNKLLVDKNFIEILERINNR